MNIWKEIEQNAVMANDAFTRAHKFVEGWLLYRDKCSGLFPENIHSDLWTPNNAAADLYPFMVLTSYYTNPVWLSTIMRDVLHTEIQITTQIRRLPDIFSFKTQSCLYSNPNINSVIYGASEYIKDGLLPITEVLGRDEWFYRMVDIIDDILDEAPIESRWGLLPSNSSEVNGEILQVLCRLFQATANPRYLDMICRISDAYFLEVLPVCNGLPVQRWDFNKHFVVKNTLRLIDHGNEIISGLVEAFAIFKLYDSERYICYEPVIRRMINTLLLVAVNSDGLFYKCIEPGSLTVLDNKIIDTWGYVFSAVYTLYLLTGDEKYRVVTEKVLHNINKDCYKEWGIADDFADSIEGGLVLLNRLPVSSGFTWLEDIVPVFLSKQKDSGIIEGWHGDGNYARTALMYALYKTMGLRIEPWDKDVYFGAVVKNNALYILLKSSNDWNGHLYFDHKRHRNNMGLHINYPRLNEFPEWYTVEHTKLYGVQFDNAPEVHSIMGSDLIRGIDLRLNAGQETKIIVSCKNK